MYSQQNEHPNYRSALCWRTLILSSFITLVVIVIIIVSIKFAPTSKDIEGDSLNDVCLTESCARTAVLVLENMDTSIDPCDDFYKFVCGNFKKSTIIPDDKSSIDEFLLIDDTIESQMRTVLEEPIKSNEPRHFALIKGMYRACIDSNNIEAISLHFIKQIIKSTGGWPVTEGANWKVQNFDWVFTNLKLIETGFSGNIFISSYVDNDYRDSGRRSFYVDQPIDSHIDVYMRRGFNETVVQSYYNLLVKIALEFGADQNRAVREMKEVVDFQIELTRIKILSEEARNMFDNIKPLTIKQLKQELPFISWFQYINGLVSTLTGKHLGYNDEVLLTNPEYFKKLSNLLQNSDRRTMANYMYTVIIQEAIPYLNNNLMNLVLQFDKIYWGISERESRWKECVRGAVKSLEPAAGALYIKRLFNPEIKKTMNEIVNNIREEFIDVLPALSWMDDITKKHAVKKAMAMTFYVAYPDELLNDTIVEDFYRNLTLDPTMYSYLESVLNINLFMNRYKLLLLERTVDEHNDAWLEHCNIAEANAGNLLTTNSIVLQAGLLQGIFFDLDRPQYMNYGGVGSVIGHELTHGFDDQGRKFGKDGSLKDWWQPETKSAFDKKCQCIVDQYSSITLSEINMTLNGVVTLGENIADNGGVKQAYLAYKKWAKEHDYEASLPGLPYTPEQMYWIAYGLTNCFVQRKQELKDTVQNDVHSPRYYRTNVPVMNSNYFAVDFKCPQGSKMNPKHKCEVW